jgi:hypothetical protein
VVIGACLDSSFEVRFNDHLVYIIVTLSIGGVNRILVDLEDLFLDFSIDCSVHVLVECMARGI